MRWCSLFAFVCFSGCHFNKYDLSQQIVQNFLFSSNIIYLHYNYWYFKGLFLVDLFLLFPGFFPTLSWILLCCHNPNSLKAVLLFVFKQSIESFCTLILASAIFCKILGYTLKSLFPPFLILKLVFRMQKIYMK